MTSTTRALIAAARAGLDPDPAAAARVRAKLNVALGGAAPVAAAPVAAGGLALKLAAVIAVATAVTTAAVVAVPSHRSQATAVPVPAVVDTAVVEAPAVRVHTAAPELAVPAVAPPHHARPVIAIAETPDARPSAAEVNLSREVELIDRAMASLRSGSAAAALASIALFDKETFGRGQMAEEAAAIEIEARCTLREDVSKRLAAFDHKWPSSSQRTRITAACRK